MEALIAVIDHFKQLSDVQAVALNGTFSVVILGIMMFMVIRNKDR